MELSFRNVNDAFRHLTRTFSEDDVGPPMSRRPYSNPNGSGVCTTIDEPVTITYSHPRERVLFNQARDANPFFHLYEALWMLAGRNDVAPLRHYNSKFDFSDDGVTQNGAYGYRWRYSWNGSKVSGIDQLDLLVAHLREQPKSRRAVLAMWNVEDDLVKIGGPCDCGADRTGPSAEAHRPICSSLASKDVCCNLNVMFSIRSIRSGPTDVDPMERTMPVIDRKFIDMTVTNRSNDLVFGLLGANYVSFSILQEYMAARVGVSVGKYHHFTNNLHAYDWNFKPAELMKWEHEEGGRISYDNMCNRPVPLVSDPEAFEKELPAFVEHFSGKGREPVMLGTWAEPFLLKVAEPMLTAFRCHKINDTASALKYADTIASDDWKLAAYGWLERRAK